MLNRMTGEHVVDIFSISPRTTDERKYWKDICDIVVLSDQFWFSGVLCFAGNDTMIEPWLVAQHICATSRHLRPLVATNPMYMHPFTAAKMITSLSLMYGRRADVNLIIGTSSADQTSLNDLLEHDQRYERLTEYALVIKRLLTDARPVTFQGRYYTVKDAMIRPRIKESLLPTFYLAGNSAASKNTANAVGAVELVMLRAELEVGVTRREAGTAIYMGIIARPTSQEAWQIAHDRYPPDREGEKMLEFSMQYTEARWKRQLKNELALNVPPNSSYWLEPFRSFRADCPYFVGSYETVAEMLAKHLKAGIQAFVIDMWPMREEFRHVATAFSLAGAAVRPDVGNVASQISTGWNAPSDD